MSLARFLSMRSVLTIDAVITGAVAVLMLAGAPFLADLLELPTALLAGAGAVLVPYVSFLLWLARRTEVSRRGVLLAIGLNVGWAVACVTVLAVGAVEPNVLGTVFVLAQAGAVLVFADMQVLALRSERRVHARQIAVDSSIGGRSQ